ncbi:MAG: VanW family protein [Corallococcus sp.]|nr:VanW family protein [Corallococcus sp.]
MKIKYKLTFAIALVILMTGAVLFLGTNAYAEKPWNVKLRLHYGDKVWDYNLETNLTNLTANQKEARKVYYGLDAKCNYVNSLVKSGFTSRESVCYVLCGFKSLLDDIEAHCNRQAVDATVEFTPQKDDKFVFTEGRNGRKVNEDKLFATIFGGQTDIEIPVDTIKAVSVADLKKTVVKKAVFTTSYASSGANRSHNVALAVKRIKGTVLEEGAQFSFNDTVGDRAEKNGFKNAKVISYGKYVEGVGGGVCQVSTTLYNALLLANLSPDELHQHTLVSSYVAAGFDAMVSYGTADLKFTNDSGGKLYIDASSADRQITFTVYGVPNKYRIVRQSIEVERVPYQTVYVTAGSDFPELIYDDQTKVVTGGSDYVKSQSYLLYYDGGKLVKKQRIRANVYKRVDKVVARGAKQRPAETSEI